MKSGELKKYISKLTSYGIKKLLDYLFHGKPSSESKPPPPNQPPEENSNESKVHAWRLCPIGEHWVRTHPLTVPVSKKNPEGITDRDGHCAKNPIRRKNQVIQDYLSRNEIEAIATNYFSSLTGSPHDNNLGFVNGNEFDHLIRGWTKYWNEVLKPAEALDPDLVKALIGSESSFNLKPPPQNARGAGMARGLIQLTDEAVKALGNPQGELKDHLVEIDQQDTSNPNMSICAGIRWLFHKNKLASNDLKREASWIETVAKYKGCLKSFISGKNGQVPEDMKPFLKLYKRLKQ